MITVVVLSSWCMVTFKRKWSEMSDEFAAGTVALRSKMAKGLMATEDLSVWSFYILPASAWVLYR